MNKFFWPLLFLLLLCGLVIFGFHLQSKENKIVDPGKEKNNIVRLATQDLADNVKKLKTKKQAEINNLKKEIKTLEAKVGFLEDTKVELEIRKSTEINDLKENINILGAETGLLREAKIAFENQKTELENEVIILKNEIKNLPSSLEEKLENPTWAELKDFLRKDKTNEIVFDDKRFDCSGFAITLFRNARANGIRTAYAEVVFDNYGHALNKFKTTDKGYVFIDNTGNKRGTGRDSVAYIKKGELFGTIYISSVIEERIDCARINLCSDFATPLPSKRHRSLFDYSYFRAIVGCGKLYNRCLVELNTEIERFNLGQSNLDIEKLNSWITNSRKLFDELTKNNIFVFTEQKRVTNVEVYW